MNHRTRVLLIALIGCVFPFSCAPARAEQPESAHPPLTKADIDGMMKSLSNWGRWGADDQRGTLNLITPEKRKQAAAMVQEGVTVSLSHNVIKSGTAESPAFTQKMVTLPQNIEITSCGDQYCVAYHGF